jgi:hypothetical protein
LTSLLKLCKLFDVVLERGLCVHLHCVNVYLNFVSVFLLVCICQAAFCVYVSSSCSQTLLNLLYFYCYGSPLRWFELCIHVAKVLIFMSKLPSKLQALINFKYKYLFSDRIPKRDGATSS